MWALPPRGVRELWSKPLKGLELREFLRVAQRQEAPRPRLGVKGTPPPCFLQEYDSMGVKVWGCAKNMILWELGTKLTLRLRSGQAVDPSTTLRAGEVDASSGWG